MVRRGGLRRCGGVLAAALAFAVLAGAAGASHTTQTQFLITPTRFDFGDVKVGKTSPDQQVTVTNATSSPIVVSMAGGAGGDFGGFQDCQGKTLAPAASCHITYQFTPPRGGPDTGSTSGSINGQNVRVRRSAAPGSPTIPSSSITPTRLDFGKVQVGNDVAGPAGDREERRLGSGRRLDGRRRRRRLRRLPGLPGQDARRRRHLPHHVPVHAAVGRARHAARRRARSTASRSRSPSAARASTPKFRISGTRLRLRRRPGRRDLAGPAGCGDEHRPRAGRPSRWPAARAATSAASRTARARRSQSATPATSPTSSRRRRPGPTPARPPARSTASRSAFDFKGNGVAPRFLVSATRFDFGEVPVGTTSPNQQVTVTNVGIAPVTVSMAGGAGGVFGGFQDCQGKTARRRRKLPRHLPVHAARRRRGDRQHVGLDQRPAVRVRLQRDGDRLRHDSEIDVPRLADAVRVRPGAGRRRRRRTSR